MVKITTKDSVEELYTKSEEYLGELYDILTTGVKLGLLMGYSEGESLAPKDVTEGIKIEVDELLSDIIRDFDDKAKTRINDVYRCVIDEI